VFRPPHSRFRRHVKGPSRGFDIAIADRTQLHALIGPNGGAGKTQPFNCCRNVRAGTRARIAEGQPISGHTPEDIAGRRYRAARFRSTNLLLFQRLSASAEKLFGLPCRRGIGGRFRFPHAAGLGPIDATMAETDDITAILSGLAGIENHG